MDILETHPAPVLKRNPYLVPPQQFHPYPWVERDAFYEMLPELLEKYPEQYVAVSRGRVVGNGTDKIELYERIVKEMGDVPVFVHYVSKAQPQLKLIPNVYVVREGC